MERRIADVPASEWDDLNIDLTPRDAILSYLMHAFPVQLQEPFTDDGGNLLSRPARDADGNPVICKEAEDRRDAADREARGAAAGADGARPDRAAFRARGRGGSHGPVPARAQDYWTPRANGWRCAAGPPPPTSPRPPPSWTARSASWCSPWPAARAGATTRTSPAGTRSGASTTCWSPAGAPTRRSRGWAAPTGRTRPRRRCSAPLPRT